MNDSRGQELAVGDVVAIDHRIVFDLDCVRPEYWNGNTVTKLPPNTTVVKLIDENARMAAIIEQQAAEIERLKRAPHGVADEL